MSSSYEFWINKQTILITENITETKHYIEFQLHINKKLVNAANKCSTYTIKMKVNKQFQAKFSYYHIA